MSSDVRGNITANAYRNQAYQFDLAHRMNAVTGKESYLYDGHGRRARTLNLQTGTIEYFGYGKDGRLLQDWSNRRQVRNGYIYLGNTLVGLYEVNLTNGIITPKYQHTDALGSPVVTTNASKTVLSRMSYTPYGQPTLPMDGVGYTGHFVDVGTQLTYMQQRYYDPTIASFLAPDPIPSDSEQNFNRFRYANGSPLLMVDRDGREPDLARVVVTAPKPLSGFQWRPIPLLEFLTARALAFGSGITLLVWPSELGAHPCEMPGGPRCGTFSKAFPKGFWPGNAGAAEWGKRNTTPKDGKDRFHRGVKEHTPGARGDHDFGVNPDTGDVCDPNGETVGNLNDEDAHD